MLPFPSQLFFVFCSFGSWEKEVFLFSKSSTSPLASLLPWTFLQHPFSPCPSCPLSTFSEASLPQLTNSFEFLLAKK